MVCKNVECNNETINNNIYCSLSCRNIYTNKFLRDYNKISKSFEYKRIKLEEEYLLNPSLCNNCDEILEYKKRKNKYCSSSCSASCNNSKRKVIKSCINCDIEISSDKYCSNKCQADYERNIIFERIENGDTSLDDRNYKNYLIYLYGNKCMSCGWCEVHDVTGNVPIQLDHINGDSYNNSLNNLRLLCPNCHSLTPTYGYLNKGNGRKNRKR